MDYRSGLVGVLRLLCTLVRKLGGLVDLGAREHVPVYSAVVVAIHVHESRWILFSDCYFTTRTLSRRGHYGKYSKVKCCITLHPHPYPNKYALEKTVYQPPKNRSFQRGREGCCVITSSFLRLPLVRLRYYITLVFFQHSLLVGYPIRCVGGCKGGRGLVSRYGGPPP